MIKKPPSSFNAFFHLTWVGYGINDEGVGIEENESESLS